MTIAKPVDTSVRVFTTAPQSTDHPPESYPAQVARVSRWSEEAGCAGMLIYTDNRIVDAWLVAQMVLRSTRNFLPLVATQPAYMHPYAAAKMIASLGFLHGRRIFLNMVAGGFRNDLLALGDDTPHDSRYDRLREYTRILKDLLGPEARADLDGRFYQVSNLRMTPALPGELQPEIFVSGSSEAGRAAARELDAVAVEYPKPGQEYDAADAASRQRSGIRLGIVTHEDEAEAWRIARRRFPDDRRGQLTQQMAMKVSDSAWHKQLAAMDDGGEGEESPYWLHPFRNYRTFCPYLVGSHRTVAAELRRYLDAGFRNFILDIPAAERDVRDAGHVFALAREGM